MPFKWVQCRVCARTMHINAFPEPHHRALKMRGSGTCKQCDGMEYSNKLISASISEFQRFVLECEACQ